MYAVWGFEGQLAGNEAGLLLRNPIVYGHGGALLIARSYPFDTHEGVLSVSLDAVEDYGTAIQASEPLEISSTDRLAIMGPRYADALAELDPNLMAGWHSSPHSPPFFYRPADKTLFRRIAEEQVRRALEEVKRCTAELDPGVRSEWCERLLGLLEVNPEMDREAYYLAEITYLVRAGRPEGIIRRTAAIGAEVVGLSSDGLLARVRRPAARSVSTNLDRVTWRDLIVGGSSVERLTEMTSLLDDMRGRGELHLDFSRDAVDASPHQRFSKVISLALANLLVGEHVDTPVRFTAPHSSDPLRLVLERAGIAFALERRDPATDLREDALVPTGEGLASSAQLQLRLVEDSVRIRSTRGFLRFGDPHLEPRGSLPRLYSQHVKPWLTARLQLARAQERKRVEQLLGDIGRVVLELLGNVRDHAQLDQYNLKQDASLLQLYVTRGSWGESANRLYVLVSDTGNGIVRTVRKAYPDDYDAMDTRASSRAVVDAVEGRLARDESNRRYGLPDIREICEAYAMEQEREVPSSHLLILTEDSEGPNGVVLNLTAGAEGESENIPSLPFRGTTVLVRLPLMLSSGVTRQAQVPAQLTFLADQDD